ncbi:MAG: hypothetical protein H7338_16545 [Candidatus Sericytochromatia bacterium]|nr:hypothetical protein [Candidatus Sericytochromatia bacterium]
MYVGKTFKFAVLWHFAHKNLLRTLAVSTAACSLYKVWGVTEIAIPFLPVATIGTAVAFYIGFKNNQAYDRLWEARRLWGGITNTSRSLGAMVMAFVPDLQARDELFYRHLAYVNILRLQLRRTIPWATSRENLHQSVVSEAAELGNYELAIKQLFIDYGKMDIYDRIKDRSSIASGALYAQIDTLTELKRAKTIDDFEHSDLVRKITELIDLQGGCERIKYTPLFRQYSIFSRIFVDLFIFLIPFALLTEMSRLGSWQTWLTVPFSLLISWVFFTMEQIGEFSENPFDSALHDTPMSTICRNIEIDLLEMLGRENLPPRLHPHNNVLL